ncbi:MAG TPA: hypothetical protein DCZ00_05920, partial [Lactococcus sp.]|uniref:Metal-sensitive transcriptional regulator n=1 Tax=Lactococcus muris TaxID=2941330 RepID=A0ABV4D7Y5_9LACT|nr:MULTISPECIES: metal-sensitive transcriptional regulator [Lactococcus]MBL3716550.1 metal-sensing transcriptional repressor [Lactococcus garvieae]HBC90965.1 hypothetical protein [Lactococcus sp.]
MDKYDKKMMNRLKRAEGQLQGVLRMMESEKDCIDVVTQLTAVRSSLDNLIGLIVAENLKNCLLSEDSELHEEKINQAIKMIVKK